MKEIKHFFSVCILLLISFVYTLNAQVTTFPYQEGFETDFGDWQQSTTDDFDWARRSGGTQTLLTGPGSAFEGDWYVYAEADNHNNQSSGLYAIFDFNSAGISDINFDFSYHMYCLTIPWLLPDQMGTLNLYISTDNGSSWNNLWSVSGNQGNDWHRVQLDLSAYTSFDNVYIDFQAQIGNGNRSDIAIDNIKVYETPDCNTLPYLVTFDGLTSYPLGWQYDNLWMIDNTWPGTNPISGSHSETPNNKTGSGTLYSLCADASSNTDLHVRFYNYWAQATFGNHNGYFYGSPDGGSTAHLIDEWDNNSADEEDWKEYDISSWADNASDLIFWWELDQSGFLYFGDGWAFDHFEVKEGDWNYMWEGNTDTDWNITTNWENNTIPDQYSDATIPQTPVGGNYPESNSGTSANCRDLYIESGSHLNISPNTDLTVHNTITNYGNATALVIDADATGMGSILHNTQYVQGTVEQYITSERWHLVSSPISDAVINTYYDIYLKEYNEATDVWTYLVEPVTIPMNVPQGYAAWASDIYTGTTISLFAGTLNVGDFNVSSLSYTPAATMTGFNLIGNPYPCALDWNTNWTANNNISGWAVVYDNGTYRGWNPLLTGNNRSYNGKTDGIIPVSNGFWVRALNASASLTIPASERVHDNQAFYKDTEQSTNGSIRLAATANDYIDETSIIFHENGSSGFDGLYDLEKFYNVDESPQIYSVAGDKNYAVNVMGELNSNTIIPIGYQMITAGDYTIEATEIENIGGEFDVYLEDVLSGEMIDLRKQSQYNFYFSPGDNSHRFNLHFSKSSTVVDEVSENSIKVYSNDKNIHISTEESIDTEVFIFDLMGKKIDQYHFANLQSTTINLNVKMGYYIVKVITPKEVISEKVFIK